MRFFSIVPIIALFGSLVASVPVNDPKAVSMPLDFEHLCLVCETLPRVIRETCYKHCLAVTQDWVKANSTTVSNTTVSAPVARYALPPVSNTTPTSSLALSNVSVDAVGICDFCHAYSGKLGAECQEMCGKHAPTKMPTVNVKPFVTNPLWNFCQDGCKAHLCKGAGYGQCFGKCYYCFDKPKPSPMNVWPEFPHIGEAEDQYFNWDACFCPIQEFADRYEDDKERYEEAIDDELGWDGEFSDGDRTDAEDHWN